MKDDAANVVASCVTCQEYSPKQQAEPLQPHNILTGYGKELEQTFSLRKY